MTNDDGVESEGLAALARALAAVGDVFVVAPASNQTAVARAITLTPTIAVDEVELGDGRPGAHEVRDVRGVERPPQDSERSHYGLMWLSPSTTYL